MGANQYPGQLGSVGPGDDYERATEERRLQDQIELLALAGLKGTADALVARPHRTRDHATHHSVPPKEAVAEMLARQVAKVGQPRPLASPQEVAIVFSRPQPGVDPRLITGL